MLMKQIENILVVFTLLTLSLYAKQSSFNCSKVEKQICEAIICGSDTLMDLDIELSNTYKQALTKATKEDMLKAYQRGWIKSRNECWKVKDAKAYMVELYHQRTEELKEKYHLQDYKSQDDGSTDQFEKTLSLQGITFTLLLLIKVHSIT